MNSIGPTGPAVAGATPVAERIRSILDVARRFRTGVELEALSDLLPDEGPRGAAAVSEWLSLHPEVALVRGELAFPHGGESVEASRERRRLRGERYLAEARRILQGPIAPARPLLLFVGVSGSTAYGEPDESDDLDLFVVTRTGAVWVFLLYAYLSFRLRRRSPGALVPCLNYVLGADAAARAFATPQGLLFAREALSLRPLVGEEYYRSILANAGWIRDELPRMYDRWGSAAATDRVVAPRAGLAVRSLNAVLFPLVAAYLQAVGMVRNRRLARAGRSDRSFRTVAGPDRMTFTTTRFDRLRSLYAGPREVRA